MFDDISGMAAVLLVDGGPVAAGVVDHRYQFQDGFPNNPGSTHPIDITFGFAPESLRVRWDWEGDEAVGVEATINVRGATFYARSGECQVDIDLYEEEVRTFHYDDPETGERLEWSEPFASVTGWLTCDDLLGVRMDEPVSVQGVFKVPSLGLISE